MFITLKDYQGNVVELMVREAGYGLVDINPIDAPQRDTYVGVVIQQNELYAALNTLTHHNFISNNTWGHLAHLLRMHGYEYKG